MQRNREVKTLLDWREARASRPRLSREIPWDRAALRSQPSRSRKAIATGFRTELSDHVVSLDLLGSTIAKHYVARRPQCPVCGNKKLINQRRAPTPIELTAGAKSIMTSGGYRTVSSRATVARYRKHVSPLCGVVSRLERIEADLPLNNNYPGST